MKIEWKTPPGTVHGLYKLILDQPHTLIAGATGSGKSVAINGIIYTALYKPPQDLQLVLIDPKRVELVKYRKLSHCIAYASEPADIVRTLKKCVDLMERRYKAMQARGMVKSTEPETYIVIDEFADLMTTNKRETLPTLCRLAQLGRAANIHLILATQRPTRDIVNGQIKVNLDCRLALRCPSARDSVNILDRKGAELLPQYGQGIISTPATYGLVDIPYIQPDELTARVQWWTAQTPRLYKFVKPTL